MLLLIPYDVNYFQANIYHSYRNQFLYLQIPLDNIYSGFKFLLFVLEFFTLIMSKPTTLQAASRLKSSFLEDKQTFGAWQMLPGSNISRLLARSGVDWVLVDCEHGNIDGENQSRLLSLDLK